MSACAAAPAMASALRVRAYMLIGLEGKRWRRLACTQGNDEDEVELVRPARSKLCKRKGILYSIYTGANVGVLDHVVDLQPPPHTGRGERLLLARCSSLRCRRPASSPGLRRSCGQHRRRGDWRGQARSARAGNTCSQAGDRLAAKHRGCRPSKAKPASSSAALAFA